MYKLVVLSCLLAATAAKPSGLGLGLAGWAGPLAAPLGAHWGAPLGAHWGAPLGAHWGASLAAPLVSHVAAPVAAPVALGAPALGAYNYRGPLSLAPGQPANILATDGRPLDTLSVNLDRAAHYTARAVDHAGGHVLGKRSAPLLAAPAAWSHAWPGAGLVAPAPLALPAAHLGPAAHLAPWGVGPLGLAGHLAHHW